MSMAKPKTGARRPAVPVKRKVAPRSHVVNASGKVRLKLRQPRAASPGLGKIWAALLAPFFIFLIFGLLLIWERVAVERLAKTVAQLETQRTQLAEQNTRLVVQAEQLGGYGRISRIARERLHMIRVATKLIVVSQE